MSVDLADRTFLRCDGGRFADHVTNLILFGCALIRRTTHTLLCFVLAGWCSILPVLAQVCPCNPTHSSNADCCGNQPEPESATQIHASCCSSCVPHPASNDSNNRLDQRESGPRDCRCDQAPEFLLFTAEVSEFEPQDGCVLQPAEMDLAWPSLPARLDTSGDGVPPLRLCANHQRKLATLGVWRL